MIARVVPVRRDGGSSLVTLAAYIRRGAATVDMQVENIYEIEHAGPEMQGLAQINHRVKNPGYHVIVSWREGEEIKNEIAFECGRKIVRDLGFGQHQAMFAIHRNTKNQHLHICINRVNPVTGKAHSPSKDFLILSQSCRELELKYKFQHDRGAHKIVQIKPGEMRIDRDRKRIPRQSTRARDAEVRTGEISFQSWISDKPAHALQHVLATPNSTWHEVHMVLENHGIEIVPRKNGLVVREIGNSKHVAKASQMGRFASKSHLEGKLGPYVDVGAPSRKIDPELTYKRDPRKRLDARYELDEQRRTLRQKYEDRNRKFTMEFQAKMEEQRASEKRRMEFVREIQEIRHKKIMAQEIPDPMTKKLSLATHNLISAHEKELLRNKFADERKKIVNPKFGGWREFLAFEAKQHDRAAAEELRRLRYKMTEPEIKIGDLFVTGHGPARKISLTGLERLRVEERNHEISFKIDDVELFRDVGHRIKFLQYDEESIRAGLLVSAEKWGIIKLHGDDKFKHKAAEVAFKQGIEIDNPELLHLKPKFKIDLGYEGPRHKIKPKL